MSTRFNWRSLLGEFFVVVLGVLVALWVNELKDAHTDAVLEVQYLHSLVTDIDTDLAQFDTADAWSRRQEAAAATVLALYDGPPPKKSMTDLVTAVETAGWQAVPSITRNTIDDLNSTGNLRLIKDPALRRSINAYYAEVENAGIPIAAMRDRMWNQYDAKVGHVLGPRVRLRVLQGKGSFGREITSDAVTPGELPDLADLVKALKAFPELKIAAGEVLYQSINNRAGVAGMRKAALELRGVLEQQLGSRD